MRAFQIFYDEKTRAALDPGFEPLDNQSNERPDWYEYWPIRRFLLSHSLEPDTFYGFFSPLFFQKTGLKGREVIEFARQATDAEVVTFSPHPCLGAYYASVFEQGASCFDGFIDAATLLLRELKIDTRLDMLVNDSRDTVYSNFFLAKPRFWKAWWRVVDRAFEIAERADSAAGRALVRPVSYVKDDGDAKPAQMKVMVLERLVSLMLAGGDFRVGNFEPFAMPLTDPFAGRLAEVVELDRLKRAYRDTGERRYFDEFLRRRMQLLAAMRAGLA